MKNPRSNSPDSNKSQSDGGHVRPDSQLPHSDAATAAQSSSGWISQLLYKDIRLTALQWLGVIFVLAGLLLNPWLLAAIFEVDNIRSIYIVLILFFDAAIVIMGVLIYRKTIDVKSLLLLFASSIICLFLSEFALRIFYEVKRTIDPKNNYYSSDFGWLPHAEQHRVYAIEGIGNIDYSTGKHGFRVFGDPRTKKRKILVIGDSFTQAEHVSDGEAYYNFLAEKNPDLEFFVFGCGGYSTTQEYLIIEKYFELIQPDMLLWQLCPNDIINNDLELETRSFQNNNLMSRPYLINGRIKLKFPSPDYGAVYSVVQSSYLCKLLNLQFNSLKNKYKLSIEYQIDANHPDLIRAVDTTNQIFAKVRAVIKDTPVLAFTSGNYSWSQECFMQICKKNDFIYIEGVPESVDQAYRKGIKVDFRPVDYHWSKIGNQIAAERIQEVLQQEKQKSNGK